MYANFGVSAAAPAACFVIVNTVVTPSDVRAGAAARSIQKLTQLKKTTSMVGKYIWAR